MASSSNRSSLTSAQQAILTTILYSDIFSFPLTKDEMWKFLIKDTKISREEFDSSLKSLKQLVLKDGYYCLEKRYEIIGERKKNLSEVVKKLELAQKVARKLSHIPSILFIGITGGLAVGNADETDDIDLVIITQKNTLFTTRFLVLLVLEFLGVRRLRNQKKTADTICVNLLFDITALSSFEEKQDIYTAREISQIQPLFDRDDTYRDFLKANSWIKKFLPNSTFSKPQLVYADNKKVSSVTFFINPFFESVLRFLQMRWMMRHRTKELVTKHILAFHPNDYRMGTLKELRLKMRQLGLLTKF